MAVTKQLTSQHKLSTTLLVVLAALLLALAGAAPTVAAADVTGSMDVNGTSFFWQLVLDTAEQAGQTSVLTAAFTTDFGTALTDAGFTGATVTVTFDTDPITPATFYVNYTVTPASGDTTVTAAAVTTAFMASPLAQVNTYVDTIKASLTTYADLMPTTPVHGWTAPTLVLFYEEVAINQANITTIVDVVASNTSDVIFYFTGLYSGWTLALQSFETPMTTELIAIAVGVLSRHNYNYTVTITDTVHQQNEDGKASRPSLKFYATVTQGMGSDATDAWNTSQIVSMLSSANYTPVLLYYNYDGTSSVKSAPATRTAVLTADTTSTTTTVPDVYIGPNVGKMSWKCNSGCIGMIIMAAVIVFLMLVTFIVVVAIVCCCCKSEGGHGGYRRASSMDIPPYPDRHSISQAPLAVPAGVAGADKNGNYDNYNYTRAREGSDSDASSTNPLIYGAGKQVSGTSSSILKGRKKGDILPAPAIVSPSSTSEGMGYYDGPSREMTTYSDQTPVVGVPSSKHVWEGR